ncbi:MAG: DUF4139 domain-containing protein [Polyangiaceae bacterium]
MIRANLKTLVAAAALLVFGCEPSGRAKYPTAEGALKLDRVVLYRNGIGYFERVGQVDDDILSIRVRKDQVNDLLKSLTVVERDSGRAVSVSMPLDPQTWANAALATLQPGRGNLAEVLDALRGTSVTLSTTDGSFSGRIVMVEELWDAPPEPSARPGVAPVPTSGTRDHRVTLLDGSDLRVVRLSKVRSVKLEDGDLGMQFQRTLDASAGEGMFQQVEVEIRLAGANTHDLLVSYVVAAPMWKPTYRVVLPKDGKGKALLQAWAVVDNTSGEDWGNVSLGLTSGAPIAFRYDLHTPREVYRADLTESGVRRQAEAYVGETTYDESPPPPPAAEPAPDDDRDGWAPTTGAGRGPGAAEKKKKELARRSSPAKTAEEAELREDYERDYNEPEKPAVDYESLRRSTQARARAATASGQTRFDLEERVTVPQGQSTMVAIVNADVEGEETFLYRPGGAGVGYEVNPYRVVRFKNSTPFVLEPGPISIYSGGSFVGEGLSETVGSETSATVPFAVEPGIMVTSQIKDASDDMRLIKLSRGVLEVEQFARRTTSYTVKAQTMDQGFNVLVRHNKAGWNYSLSQRPEGTEDLADGYLVKVSVPAGSREGSLDVVEQTPARFSISIWDQPALGLLEKLLVVTDLTPEAKKKLQPIVDKRREIGRLDEQISGLRRRRDVLDQRSDELRRNLRSIEKNNEAKAQRDKWTKQLDEFTSEANKNGAQMADLEAKRLDLRVDMEDLLQDLEITPPEQKK